MTIPGTEPQLHRKGEGLDEVVTLSWQGYSVAMYVEPNSGGMRFDIETPIDFADEIAVEVNEVRVYPE